MSSDTKFVILYQKPWESKKRRTRTIKRINTVKRRQKQLQERNCETSVRKANDYVLEEYSV